MHADFYYTLYIQAQELLTRVKERDLYSCLVRIPIPRNTSRCDSHMDNLQCKVCDKFDANLEAVKELSDKDDSFKDVILKDLQHIKHDEIWVEVSLQLKGRSNNYKGSSNSHS